VNLGSRLEGITKTYGVGVIAGPHTVKAVPGFVFQELDAVKVKGKNEPVSIYAPLRAVGAMTEDDHAQLDKWIGFLKAFRAQQWQEARTKLADCQSSLVMNPTLNELYESRIEYFERNPPSENWDGVTQFDTK
jgi:adenylate cyclase